MGNSNTEWKKEMRLFGIVFWLLPLIDVFHIIIGILYAPFLFQALGAEVISKQRVKKA